MVGETVFVTLMLAVTDAVSEGDLDAEGDALGLTDVEPVTERVGVTDAV